MNCNDLMLVINFRKCYLVNAVHYDLVYNGLLSVHTILLIPLLPCDLRKC